MADLELGETVEVIKAPDGCTIDVRGYKGIVDSRVSGGWRIELTNPIIGKFHIVVGSIDWNEYVRKTVIKDPIPSPVPRTLVKWYAEILKTIKGVR